MAYSSGTSSGSATLTDADDLYPAHINELRQSNPASFVVGQTSSTQFACDGTADDVQIQAALTAANTAGGGRVIILNSTTNYDITAKLTIYGNTILEAEDYGGVTLKAKTSLNDRLMVNTARDVGSGTDYNVDIRNFIFDCNGANQTGSTAPTFSRTDRLNLINCKFINAYDSLLLITGSPSYINNNCLLRDVHFIGTNQQSSTDLVDIGNGYNITLDNTYWYNAKTTSGISMCSLSYIKNLVILGGKFDGNNNGSPLVIYGCDGAILGAEVVNSYESGIRLEPWMEVTPIRNMTGLRIIGNDIHHNTQSGIWSRHGTANFADDYWTRGVKIIGNDIHDNARNGLHLTYHKGIDISHNDIYNNSTSGAGTYFAVNLTTPGVTYTYGVYDAIISRNHFFDTQGSVTQTKAFNIDNANGVQIEGNDFKNITTVKTEVNSPTGIRMRNNIGYVTENSGTGTIASGATTAVVTHGLGVTPTLDDLSIVFGEQGTADYGRWWISSITSTQFTLNVSVDPGASNLDFAWKAIVL